MRRRWALAAVPLLALAACGGDQVDDRQEANAPDRWYFLTDPASGLTFRCHEIISDTSHSYDVRTEWCYGPVDENDFRPIPATYPEVTIGTVP